MASNLLIGFPHLPRNASSINHNGTALTGKDSSNLCASGRPQGFELTALQTEPLEIDFTMPVAAAVEFLAIPNARQLKRQGIVSLGLYENDLSRNYPSGLAGLMLWLDAERGVTSDAYGRVSSWADQSPTAATATQSTDAAKPILSRCDDKENWLLYSEELDNSFWNKSATSCTANAVKNSRTNETTADLIYENGAAGNHRLISSSVDGFANGESYRMSFRVKAAGRTRFECYFGLAAFASGPGGSFNLGTVTCSNLNGGTCTITNLGEGWYQCTITGTAGASGAGRLDFYLANAAGSTNYTGDGASGVYFDALQISRASASTAYVKTQAARVTKGVNGRHALFFDGTDDFLTLSGTLDTYVANNAYTVFLAVRPREIGTSVATVNQNDALFQDTAGNVGIYLKQSNSVYSYNNDGAADSVNTTLTLNDVSIIEARHESGSIYLSVNGGTEVSTASGNTSSLASACQIAKNSLGGTPYAAMELCALIVLDQAAGSSVRADVRHYLDKRFRTAPVAYEFNLDNATLLGVEAEHWAQKVTLSTARAHWWLHFGTSQAAKFAMEKALFGQFFDFDRDPLWIRKIGGAREHSTSSRRAPRQFELQWTAVTNAKRNEFISNVGTRKGEQPILLYTDTYDWPLANSKALVCKIVSYEFTPRVLKQNNFRLVVEELI